MRSVSCLTTPRRTYPEDWQHDDKHRMEAVMRPLRIVLLALLLSLALAPPASACPSGYAPCGQGVCCPL